MINGHVERVTERNVDGPKCEKSVVELRPLMMKLL